MLAHLPSLLLRENAYDRLLWDGGYCLVLRCHANVDIEFPHTYQMLE